MPVSHFIFKFFTLLQLASSTVGHVDLAPCLKDDKLTNGCSIPWGIKFPYKEFFKPACYRHDVCYVCGNTHEVRRSQCDEAFLKNMQFLCHLKEKNKEDTTASAYAASDEGYSWQRFWKEVKGSWFVGTGLVKWLGLKSGSLEHCLNGARIYHDAVRHFAMKEFLENGPKDCLLPCAEYMVNPYHNLTEARR